MPLGPSAPPCAPPCSCTRPRRRSRLLGALGAASCLILALPLMAVSDEEARARAFLEQQDARTRHRTTAARQLAPASRLPREALARAWGVLRGERDRGTDVDPRRRNREQQGGGGVKRPGDKLREKVDGG